MSTPDLSTRTVSPTKGPASLVPLDALRVWLRGAELDEKLSHGLDYWLERAMDAYTDGVLGFEPNVPAVRFPGDVATLSRLTTGIEMRTLTGAVLTAYPDANQVRRMAERRAVARRTSGDHEEAALLAMPVTTFLAEHFCARGGLLGGPEARRAIDATLRWPTDGRTLATVFRTVSQALGVEPAAWTDPRGYRSDAFYAVHHAVYEDLPPQPRLREVLGTATLTVTDVRPDVPKVALLLREDDTIRPELQGRGLSFLSLLQDAVSILTPPEFLAFAGVLRDPSKPEMAPDLSTWEWLAGITHSCAADGFTGVGGLFLEVRGLEDAGEACRARSAVR